jgi:hypothetical protein
MFLIGCLIDWGFCGPSYIADDLSRQAASTFARRTIPINSKGKTPCKEVPTSNYSLLSRPLGRFTLSSKGDSMQKLILL